MVVTTVGMAPHPHTPYIPHEGDTGGSDGHTTASSSSSSIPPHYGYPPRWHVVRDQWILGVSIRVIVILTDMCNRLGIQDYTLNE